MGYYRKGRVSGGFYAAAASTPAAGNALVSGAGSEDVNGLYTPRGISDGRTYWNKEGEPDDPFTSAISSDGNWWIIYLSDGGSGYGNNGEFVPNPWESAEWVVFDGREPVPAVTQG